MKLEDYSKYYIQGSDHYLIPKDEFVELFNEMINWKQEIKKMKKGEIIIMKKEELDRYRIRDYYMIPIEIVDNVFYEFETQLKKQQEINQKAIEYINKFKDSPEYIDAYDITYWQEEVLAILENKEETDTNVGEV